MTFHAQSRPTLEISVIKFFPTHHFVIIFSNSSHATSVPIKFENPMDFEESLSALSFQKSVYSEAQAVLEELCALLFEYAKRQPSVYELSLIRRNRYEEKTREAEAVIFKEIEKITAISMEILNELYLQIKKK